MAAQPGCPINALPDEVLSKILVLARGNGTMKERREFGQLVTRVCRRWREVYLRDALRALRLATSNMHAAAAGGAGSPGTPTSRRKAWLAGKAGLLRQRGGLIEELAVEDGGCELFGGAPAQPSLAEERGCWPAEEFAALLPRTLGALSWSAEAPPPPPIWEALPSLARLTSLTLRPNGAPAYLLPSAATDTLAQLTQLRRLVSYAVEWTQPLADAVCCLSQLTHLLLQEGFHGAQEQRGPAPAFGPVPSFPHLTRLQQLRQLELCVSARSHPAAEPEQFAGQPAAAGPPLACRLQQVLVLPPLAGLRHLESFRLSGPTTLEITGVPPAGCSGLRRCVYGRGRLELQGATRWAALPQLVAALLPLGAPLQALAADGLPEAEAELDALKQLPSLRQLRVRRTRGEDVDGVRLHLRVVAPHLEQVQIVG